MHSIKMRRNNKILLGLLAMLLVMSTGYALFSKEITIGGNVTAKGSFNITLACSKDVSSEVKTAWANKEGSTVAQITSELNAMQHGYTTDTCSVSGSSVAINTALSYPGAGRFYTIVVKNEGDIPAKWHSVDGFTGTFTMCYGTDASECVSAEEPTFEDFVDALGVDPSIGLAGIKDTTNTFNFILLDGITTIVDSEGYIVLEPGESMYFLAYNLWRPAYLFNYADGEYHTVNYNFEFNFEQATE